MSDMLQYMSTCVCASMKKKINLTFFIPSLSALSLSPSRSLCYRITMALHSWGWWQSPVTWWKRPSTPSCSVTLQRAGPWCSSGWSTESPGWTTARRRMSRPSWRYEGNLSVVLLLWTLIYLYVSDIKVVNSMLAPNWTSQHFTFSHIPCFSVHQPNHHVCVCVSVGLVKAPATGRHTDVLPFSDMAPQDREKCFNMPDTSRHEMDHQPLVCWMLGASWHSSVSMKCVCVFVCQHNTLLWHGWGPMLCSSMLSGQAS